MESIDNTPQPSPSASMLNKAHPNGFPALLDMLPVAAYTCDTEGKITSYNAAAAELWGQAPDIGITTWHGAHNLRHIDGRPMAPDEFPIAAALRGQRIISGQEIITERPDGSRRYVISDAQPLYDEKGIITGGINTLVDITEKKMREDLLNEKENEYRSVSELLEKKVDERTLNLKKSEERYHKMIEEVQDYAILLLDSDGYILNWNLGAEKIKGYTEKEIIGKNFRIFYQTHDREGKLPEKLIQEAHDTGRARHEGWRVRKDGSRFWGSVVITALHDDDNNIIGFSKVTRDLTEKKIADDRMQNYAMEIEFRNKQLEEYAYIASHDLQEPLRKIQIFAEMLENSLGNEEMAKKQLDKINSAAKRMSNLIKDVLKYSQLSRADELFADVDLNNVIATIKDDFELLIEQKHVRLEHGRLPVLKGIPIQLHQLFANLVNNAIKFSSADPHIRISSENADPAEVKTYEGLNEARPYVKITVQDNGIGFEQQYGEQVFKMFKRLSDNSGTGIGLALCKKIVENHNGQISVLSEPGKGTEFTILLPTGANTPITVRKDFS